MWVSICGKTYISGGAFQKGNRKPGDRVGSVFGILKEENSYKETALPSCIHKEVVYKEHICFKKNRTIKGSAVVNLTKVKCIIKADL